MNTIAKAEQYLALYKDGILIDGHSWAKLVKDLVKLAEFKEIVINLPKNIGSLSDRK